VIEYYVIIALSFGIMYTYSYGLEIVQTVRDVEKIVTDNAENIWNSNLYIFFTFIVSSIAMPIFLGLIIIQKKYDTIKYASAYILKKYYGLTNFKK